MTEVRATVKIVPTTLPVANRYVATWHRHHAPIPGGFGWFCVTYTLAAESGASLRGAGWVREADGITSWWHKGMSRTPAVNREHMDQRKVRWALTFREPLVYQHTQSAPVVAAQESLFGGGVA